MPYAYHFDASLYGQYLRKYSEQRGVKRTEGLVEDVDIDPESGQVRSLRLRGGRVIEGDFFIDCSGIRGLLIHQKLGAGYEDWSHWLPCDRAMAVPSERFEDTLPFTRSIAHSAGWQWRIPLRHRNGERPGLQQQPLQRRAGGGYPDEQPRVEGDRGAQDHPLPDRAHAQAVASQRGSGRPLQRLPGAFGINQHLPDPVGSRPPAPPLSRTRGSPPELRDEYNRRSQREYELIRDFIIMHYYLNERDDSQFWRDTRNMDVPERLTEKIGLFRANGSLVQDQVDIFLEYVLAAGDAGAGCHAPGLPSHSGQPQRGAAARETGEHEEAQAGAPGTDAQPRPLPGNVLRCKGVGAAGADRHSPGAGLPPKGNELKQRAAAAQPARGFRAIIEGCPEVASSTGWPARCCWSGCSPRRLPPHLCSRARR